MWTLVNKVNYIFNFLMDNNISILGVSETWLLPSIPTCIVAIPTYEMVRCDVEGDTPKHGVCLYVKNC